MKTGLESLDTGASNITYSGNEGPKSPQQIAEADYILLEEYQKYVFEMEEMGLEPMSFEQFRQEAMSGMAMGGRAGYASGQLVQPGPGRPGYRGDDARKSAAKMGKGAMGTTRHGPAPGSHHPPGPTKPDHRGHHSGDGPSVYKPVIIPKKPKDYYKDKSEKAYQKAKKIAQIKNIKPVGSWLQKGLYGILPNDPKLAYDFLYDLEEENPEMFNMLPENLKNKIKGTRPPSVSSGKFDFDEWSMLSQVPGYGEFLKERGKPGVLHGGDVGGLGDRYVIRDPITKEPIKDKYGNIKYGYHESTGSGEGQARELLNNPYPYQTASAPGTDTPVDPVTGFPTDPILSLIHI